MTFKPVIYWRTPAIMIGSLLSGIALALGHHFLYNGLVGTPVHDDTRDIAGFGVSSQQLNIAAGTALSFLIKVCLVLSVTIAYTQAFWKAIGKSETRIHTIDVMDSALENIWMFLKMHIWWHYPLLLTLGLSVWFIPIASTITPATLSVVIAAPNPLPMAALQVPQLDFKSLKFINPGLFHFGGRQGDVGTQMMLYNGPSIITQRIVKTTAALGSILSIPAPGTNASYEMSFPGPYLSCENMNDTFQLQVQKNILLNYANGSLCQEWYNFLSWTSYSGNHDNTDNLPQPLPFDETKPFARNIGTLGPLSWTPVTENNDTATIYFAVMPRMLGSDTARCPALERVDEYYNLFNMFKNSTFLQCKLSNTTYHAKFNFTGGHQTVDLEFRNLSDSKPVPALEIAYLNFGKHQDNEGKMVTDHCETVGQQRSSYVNCAINTTTLETLSFQAVMDSFGSLLVGGVRTGNNIGKKTIITSTNLLTTSLMSSRELAFMSTGASWRNNSLDSFPATDRFTSMMPKDPPIKDISLARNLEQLFQNITVSMMSSEILHTDNSSLFSPSSVNVTFHTLQNVYAYSALTLWLSYGIAILVTTFAVLVGMGCILSSGAAWSMDFSTILRTTRDADMSAHLAEDDGDGRAPLPKHLRNATIKFTSGVFAKRHGTIDFVKEGSESVVQRRWKQAVFGIRRTDS